MRIVIAPNAFKGSLSAGDAAKNIAAGLQDSDFFRADSSLSHHLILFPIADGGDDTLALLTAKMKGEKIFTPVHDPIGRSITSHFGWLQRERKAIIGVSDASGLRLLRKEELNPLHANTYGTGELMKAALDKEAEKLIIGLGGSATTDGATGILRALGMRFLNGQGNDIDDLPLGLLDLKAIDTAMLDKRLGKIELVVLCDVQNKLLGTEGTAAVFSPQKGAGKKEVLLLERCMEKWNAETWKSIHFDMAALPHGGAAGGIAAGLAAYTNARLVSGIEFFLDELHFDKILEKADLVITAEGRIDAQTLTGKGPYGVARRAGEKNIPVIGMAGQVPEKPGKELNLYFDKLIAINPPHASLSNAMKNTAVNLRHAALEIGNKFLPHYSRR